MILLLSGEKGVKAHRDKMCKGSAGNGPSLETSDVTLVWDDRKLVKAHKDKLCRGSAGNGPSLDTSENRDCGWPRRP